MKTIYDIYEGLLDDMEDVLSNTKNDIDTVLQDAARDEINDFLKTNYNIYGKHEIVFDKNNFATVNHGGKISTKNYNITNLTNGKFKFGEVGEFSCLQCCNLTSLEGAPSICKYDFSCIGCYNLESLVGAPQTVNGFDCRGCFGLKNLVGAPKKVKGNFNCSHCYIQYGNMGLESLEGCPQSIGGIFNCSGNKKLKSFKYGPKKVKKWIDASYCGGITEDDVKSVCKNIQTYNIIT